MLFTTLTLWAQAPQKMSYQAVVRDASEILIAETSVGMRISILEGSPTGTAVYVETHTPTTNTNGLATLEVGDGAIVSGDFTAIDWGSDDFYIKSEIDPDGGTSYTIEGVSQLLSVPYALFAENGGSGNSLDQAYDKEMTTGPTPRIIAADDGKIEIVATGNEALEITSASTHAGLKINGSGTEEAILVENGGAGDAISVTNTSIGDAIVVDNSGDGDGISIDNAGDGDALFIDNTDSDGSFAISVNNDGGSAAIDVLNIGGGAGFQLTNDGGGDGIIVAQDGAGRGVLVDNDGTGIAVEINNADNTGGEIALSINNDAGGDAISITNDGGGDALTIDNAGVGDGIFVDNLDGTGSIAISVNNDGGGAGLDVLNAGAGDALFITNTGTSFGINVLNTNAASAAESVKVTHLGTGNAVSVMNGGGAIGLAIANTNPVGTGEALKVVQSNDATAVFVDNMGIGTGVSIFNGDPAGIGNGLEVVQTGLGKGLFVDNGGLGIGAHIETLNPANADFVILASTIGTGTVVRLTTEDNNANGEVTLAAETFGTGRVAEFRTVDEIVGKLNFAPTVDVISDGMGIGLNVDIINDITGTDENIEPAIFATHQGNGSAGRFEVLNSDNLEDAVLITNKGSGLGLHVDTFDNPGVNVDASLYVEQANSSTLSSFGRTAVFDLHPASSSADAAVVIRSGVMTFGHSALRVLAADPTKKAAVFSGSVDITTDLVVGGSFSAAAKAFKIDHPLDPTNKYLIHNSIESNERINIYSGNITTNEEGYATVALPEYMNALNKDFKYQLTIVDKSFAQAIIWEGMNTETNSFVIKTNTPDITVSWQITGTRQDTWALENPMQVEVDKNSEF